MQDAEALLAAALDGDGWIAIRGFGTGSNKDKQPRQAFFKPGDFTGAAAYAAQLSAQQYDAYFATATLQSNKSAEAVNVFGVKCFKIDLDVDKNNPSKYATQSEAARAIANWCADIGFPLPNVVVNSGFGVHGYWCLDEALTADDGKVYSEKIKQIFLSTGLKFDRGITGDIVRVLRLPGTLNYKGAVARKVKLVGGSIGALYGVDALCDAIDTLYDGSNSLVEAALPDLLLGSIPAHLRGVKLDKETQSLLQDKPKSFTVLMKKCAQGPDKGCAQMINIVGNQAAQDENRWRAGLSIAHYCEDGETAVHNMSKMHPNYSYDETTKKAAGLVGPHKCSTFEASWPQHCQGCPHKGKITSPIQLGNYVPLAKKGDNIVLGQNKSVDDGTVPYTVPEYPFPYLRGARGGVYRRNDEDEDNPVEILRFDMYVVERLRDPDTQEYLLAMRLHHPTDGVIDFTARASDIGSKEGFRDILNGFGIMKVDGGVSMVRAYVVRWMEDLELKKAANMVKTQMGWTEGQKTFVIGDREINANGKSYSRAAPSLTPVAKALSKKGDPDEWKKTFNTYARPGFEAYAYCALVGFGAPLMALLDLEGMVINAYSERAGTGKTTTQHAALSIWGNSKELILSCGASGDTANSRFHRMGQYKNLPICVDEATKLKPEEMSDLLLSTTQGRAKHRMNGSSNTERANSLTWSTISLYSANTSFIDALQAEKAEKDGALKRIMEVHLPPTVLLTKEESDVVFRGFFHHYGHAGETYVQYLIKNMSRVISMVEDERRTIDQATGAVHAQDERYWSATCACIVAGGRLAQEAGLHDIDMDAIREFAVKLVKQTRLRHQYSAVIADRNSDILGEFINLHIPHTVVVLIGTIAGKQMTTPLREVSNREMFVRLEKNDGSLYVTRTALNTFLKERNVVVQTFLDDLKIKGVLIDENVQMHLGQGTVNKGGNVRCYKFKMPLDELPPLID